MFHSLPDKQGQLQNAPNITPQRPIWHNSFWQTYAVLQQVRSDAVVRPRGANEIDKKLVLHRKSWSNKQIKRVKIKISIHENRMGPRQLAILQNPRKCLVPQIKSPRGHKNHEFPFESINSKEETLAFPSFFQASDLPRTTTDLSPASTAISKNAPIRLAPWESWKETCYVNKWTHPYTIA